MQAVKKLGLWGLFTRGLPLRIVMIGTLTGAQWGIYDAFKVFVGLYVTQPSICFLLYIYIIIIYISYNLIIILFFATKQIHESHYSFLDYMGFIFYIFCSG